MLSYLPLSFYFVTGWSVILQREDWGDGLGVVDLRYRRHREWINVPQESVWRRIRSELKCQDIPLKDLFNFRYHSSKSNYSTQ